MVASSPRHASDGGTVVLPANVSRVAEHIAEREGLRGRARTDHPGRPDRGGRRAGT